MHTIALAADGSIWGWGGGSDGQPDSGSTTRRTAPFAIAASITPVTTISTGLYDTFAHFDP